MVRISLIAFLTVSALSLSACDTTQYEEFQVPATASYGQTGSQPVQTKQTTQTSYSSARDGSQPCLNNRACGT